MTNVAYVLMVRDLGSGIDRMKLDDALAGRITIRTDTIPELGPVSDEIAPIPTAQSMEELRENWGRSPDAIRQKLQFDQTLRTMPRQKPGTN